MLTIKDMSNRIAYLEKIIPMYQDEMTGLKMLAEVYANPEYNSLKELESIEQPSQVLPYPKPRATSKLRAQTHTVPKEKHETKEKVLDSRTDGTYTSKKFFNYLNGNLAVRALFLEATNKVIHLTTAPAECKELTCGTRTLSKLIRTAIDRGWFITRGRSLYIVPEEQVAYIRKHLKA